MTCAIFCSLAFCAFQIVFADNLTDDIAASISKSKDPISDVNANTYSDIQAAAYAVNSKEISTSQIIYKCTLTDAAKQFDNIFQTKMKKCQQCYHKAKNTKDIQSAENCCKKIAKELQKDAKLYNDQAKTCIADVAKICAKSATDCRKEAKNADKVYDKEYIMAGGKICRESHR